MKKQSFESRCISIEELLGTTNTFHVPLHQRDYSWDSEHVEDFWDDLLSIANEKIIFLVQ